MGEQLQSLKNASDMLSYHNEKVNNTNNNKILHIQTKANDNVTFKQYIFV